MKTALATILIGLALCVSSIAQTANPAPVLTSIKLHIYTFTETSENGVIVEADAYDQHGKLFKINPDSVMWKSDNTSVASVVPQHEELPNAFGLITVLSKGATSITATVGHVTSRNVVVTVNSHDNFELDYLLNFGG